MVDQTLVIKLLKEKQTEAEFERKAKQATYVLAVSFFVSATLNYILAKLIVTAPSGTPEFTAQLGQMTALSYPVIVLPSMIITIIALMMTLKALEKLTGLVIAEHVGRTRNRN